MKNAYIDLGTNLLGGFNELEKTFGIDESWDVIFVEPNPECHEEISKKISTMPNAKLIGKALSTDNLDKTITTRTDVYGDTAATIYDLDYLKKSINQWNQFPDSFVTYDVKCCRLIDVLKETNADNIYIKMDIEGAEFSILESDFPFEYCNKIKKLLVEFHCFTDADRERKKSIIENFLTKGIEINDWH